MGKKKYHYICFDKTKPKPKWLRQQGLANYTSWRYWNRIWDAQPIWADVGAIKRIYERAWLLREAGYDVVVDHEIPLNGPDICGLHVETNLVIVSLIYNSQLSNHDWPGQPNEQLDMFGIPSFLKYPGTM